MNGLEALETIGEIEFYELENQCEDVKTYCEDEYNTIETELKVLQILKEKKVDLSQINWLLAEQFKQTPVENKVSFYNFKMNYKKDEMLNEEEFTQIAELLKEE